MAAISALYHDGVLFEQHGGRSLIVQGLMADEQTKWAIFHYRYFKPAPLMVSKQQKWFLLITLAGRLM